MLLALLSPGCRRPGATSLPPAAGMRIVCLSPAVTDLLLALNLGDRIVGRDTWEEQLPDHVPRVGDLMSVNIEAVLALNPTDVVLQAGKMGLPARLEEIARDRGWRLINLQIDGLPDIRSAISTLTGQLSFESEPGERALATARGEALISEIDAALVPLASDVADCLGPVMLLYSTQPPSAFGPGSYVGDILESLGGHNALGGGAWQELDLERVAAAQPWALIIVKGGADDELVAHPEAALGALARLDLACVGAGRLAVLRHRNAQLPGASVIGVAQELRAILLEMGRDPRPPQP